jgi:hypothetical protein
MTRLTSVELLEDSPPEPGVHAVRLEFRTTDLDWVRAMASGLLTEHEAGPVWPEGKRP